MGIPDGHAVFGNRHFGGGSAPEEILKFFDSVSKSLSGAEGKGAVKKIIIFVKGRHRPKRLKLGAADKAKAKASVNPRLVAVGIAAAIAGGFIAYNYFSKKSIKNEPTETPLIKESDYEGDCVGRDESAAGPESDFEAEAEGVGCGSAADSGPPEEDAESRGE